ncbi:hypothetical protein EPD60_12360 [Flaviaesturariibacter flavus]|uniref:Uncharacterized protein n=1 Tax=Flaviaesturariibacter flavus TaxID=2502780 RepID=A0A4R1B9J9_9BACT|nr:hypothetical protein [Flaviaesturariibacter flavus]TCJ13584.1 hypothetical protein EPD60_12360 [Flaviaesturariibacter flavus]
MPATLAPVFKPEISFKVETLPDTERSTIVHVTLPELTLARIWPTTFLVQDDGTRKRLLHAFNITEYPHWKLFFPGERFTLVFEGLDKRCLFFDLLEDIPEPGGFHIENIERNRSDVYQVEMSDG